MWDFKDSNYLITSLCIEYIGEFIALNQKDPKLFIWIFFYKLTQTDKFSIPPTLGGTGVFYFRKREGK